MKYKVTITNGNDTYAAFETEARDDVHAATLAVQANPLQITDENQNSIFADVYSVDGISRTRINGQTIRKFPKG